MFSLHVVQAEFGDCFLLEYGTAADRHFLLIDGGPPTIFENHLRQVLQEKVVPSGGKIERVILSHVDNDHIVGLLDLFTELNAQQVNAEPALVSLGGLWHNSFQSTIDVNGVLQPRLQTLLAVAGAQMLMSDSAVSVNGIPEGNKLRQLAQLLQLPPNQDLPEPITVDTAGGPVSFANLQLTVVGPTQANLDALRDEWQKWLDKHENGIAAGDPKVMANADRSIPNLSSICVVAAADGRTILLTGDARSDHILDGLRTQQLLDGSDRVHFDVIKMPHHGSDRNMTRTFLDKVTADRYVVSANGKYDNPDLATLIWLVEAAKDQNRTPEIIATNETPDTKKLLEEYPPQDYGYSLRLLDPERSSLEVALA
jgi:beta-lactamase superfamily II metal-dependent hydrolase